MGILELCEGPTDENPVHTSGFPFDPNRAVSLSNHRLRENDEQVAYKSTQENLINISGALDYEEGGQAA